MLILGCDPGLSGALALYNPTLNTLHVEAMPTVELLRNSKSKHQIDAYALARIIDDMTGITHAYVEAVGAMPGQGTASCFSFGHSAGVLYGVLAANFIPVTFVSPVRWKKAMGITASKDGARARASQLFPRHANKWTRVKDDGIAESALIALYGARDHGIGEIHASV